MKAILVTGSREFDDELIVAGMIRQHMDGPTEVVVGDCPTGADRAAVDFIESLEGGSPAWAHVFEADWQQFGKAAGPFRNQEMVDYLTDNYPFEDITVLAFFKTGAGNRGTRNCVAAALAAGIPDSQIRRFWA